LYSYQLFQLSQPTRNQLKRLLEQLCEFPTEVMCSHFKLISTYVLTGITDIRLIVRSFSFDLLFLLMQKYPELCADSQEIFERFLKLFREQRMPTEDNFVEAKDNN
jgi:hypothetical protein